MGKGVALNMSRGINYTVILLWAYAFVSVFHQFTILFPTDSGWPNFITRALYMPLLLLYLLPVNIEPNQSNSLHLYKIKSLTLAAIGFAWVGDMLIEYDEQAEHLFMIGISAFLLSHCFFAWALFTKNSGVEKPSLRQNAWIVAITLTFCMGFVFFLREGLGEVFGSALVYLFSVNLMLAAALDRKNRTPQNSYKYAIYGTFLFILSDIVLATNKFYSPIFFGECISSITYICGQFMIVYAIRAHLLKST